MKKINSLYLKQSVQQRQTFILFAAVVRIIFQARDATHLLSVSKHSKDKLIIELFKLEKCEL